VRGGGRWWGCIQRSGGRATVKGNGDGVRGRRWRGAREERTLAGEGAATAAAELSGAEPTCCDCDGMMAEPEK
jgi:hypothetical protein